MVFRFTFPVLLLCLVFVMCGVGNAVRNLDDKYATNHFSEGDEVKRLEDKYTTAYFHRSSDSKSREEVNEVKNLEDKYATAYFHKITESKNYFDEDDGVKDLEGKYTTAYFHKTFDSENHFDGGDEVKDLEDKYATAYFHKPSDSEIHFSRGDGVKDLKDKYTTAYFHKTLNSEDHFTEDKRVKSLEDKYAIVYFHKTSNSEMKSPQEMNDHCKGHHHHHHNHVERANVGFFTLDELRAFNVGKKLPIFFPIKNHSLYPPNFLPKEVADTIPFSSSQVSNILQFFSVSPNSPRGQAIQDTLKKCELEAAQGETKICATSLESLHGFLSNAFGSEVDFKFISTRHPTITTPIFQNYTVLEPPREIESSKKVACHPMPYLYAVYFCHYDATETKAFKLQLVGDITRDKVDALVVCHMDTSGWSSNHAAFRMLGIKQGNPVCHVFSQANLIWINQPSAIGVGAM